MLTLAQIDAWEAAFNTAQAQARRRLLELPLDAAYAEVDEAFAEMRQLASTPLHLLLEVPNAD